MCLISNFLDFNIDGNTYIINSPEILIWCYGVGKVVYWKTNMNGFPFNQPPKNPSPHAHEHSHGTTAGFQFPAERRVEESGQINAECLCLL